MGISSPPRTAGARSTTKQSVHPTADVALLNLLKRLRDSAGRVGHRPASAIKLCRNYPEINLLILYPFNEKTLTTVIGISEGCIVGILRYRVEGSG
jgi:hypothetical protein